MHPQRLKFMSKFTQSFKFIQFLSKDLNYSNLLRNLSNFILKILAYCGHITLIIF